MSKEEKTNVMRLLEKSEIPHQTFGFEEISKQEEIPVYKTLVTEGKSGEFYVFLVSLESSLNLKKAAKSVSEKSLAMIPEKKLLPLTGYVHGGCSPIGMKKELKTTIDTSAQNYDLIGFSAGKVKYSVAVAPEDLKAFIGAQFSDIQN